MSPFSNSGTWKADIQCTESDIFVWSVSNRARNHQKKFTCQKEYANAKATHTFSAKILAYMPYLMTKVLTMCQLTIWTTGPRSQDCLPLSHMDSSDVSSEMFGRHKNLSPCMWSKVWWRFKSFNRKIWVFNKKSTKTSFKFEISTLNCFRKQNRQIASLPIIFNFPLFYWWGQLMYVNLYLITISFSFWIFRMVTITLNMNC